MSSNVEKVQRNILGRFNVTSNTTVDEFRTMVDKMEKLKDAGEYKINWAENPLQNYKGEPVPIDSLIFFYIIPAFILLVMLLVLVYRFAVVRSKQLKVQKRADQLSRTIRYSQSDNMSIMSQKTIS
jgi:hypothetical protein